ncbi:MAG: PEGA domain-containing protein [Polyangiaceae bacterium]
MTRRQWLALALGGVGQAACMSGVGRAAVSLRLNTSRTTPGNASVYIDEEYVGPLGYVAAHGVRLPVGQHRITVQRNGYFPWDRLVEADRQPIQLNVELVPIPD